MEVPRADIHLSDHRAEQQQSPGSKPGSVGRADTCPGGVRIWKSYWRGSQARLVSYLFQTRPRPRGALCWPRAHPHQLPSGRTPSTPEGCSRPPHSPFLSISQLRAGKTSLHSSAGVPSLHRCVRGGPWLLRGLKQSRSSLSGILSILAVGRGWWARGR